MGDTTRPDLERVLGGRAARRMLVESSTDSEWVAQHHLPLEHDGPVALDDPTPPFMQIDGNIFHG